MTKACCSACKTGKKKPCASTKKNSAATLFKWDPWGSIGRHHDNCYDYAFGLNNPRAVNKNVPGNMSGNKAWGLTFQTCDGIARRVLEDYKGLAYKCSNGSQPCRAGYYKVMNFVSPNGGDFHWYRQTTAVRYKIRAGDTITGVAKFFRVTPETIRAAVKKSQPPKSASNGRIANTNRNLPLLNTYVRSGRGVMPPGKVIQFPVKLWSHKQGWATGPILVDAKGRTIRDPRRADKNYPGLNYSRFCSAYCVKAGAGRIAMKRLGGVRKVNVFQSLGKLRL